MPSNTPEYNRKYYLKNKERHKARMKAWYAKNKEKAIVRSTAWRLVFNPPKRRRGTSKRDPQALQDAMRELQAVKRDRSRNRSTLSRTKSISSEEHDRAMSDVSPDDSRSNLSPQSGNASDETTSNETGETLS